QSSYGVLNYPGLICDYARIGIALYGVLSTLNSRTRLSPDLRPVLSLKSRIVLIRTVESGEYVGYGRNFIAERKTKIAVVSIGYGDGIPRCLSGRNGRVLIRGHRAPIVGKICMDRLMVDVTGIPEVTEGDIVTLIGGDGYEEITAEQMAENADTITNELLSRLGNRVKRIFL
ncbi:MAG: serine/alanine racemase, partial [Kosmotogales bacterium]|nr:serine/alanine racemase [Kosmotogales bacterium]